MLASRQRFSCVAGQYDGVAYIQRALAVELQQRVSVKPGSVVVDVGTGTGGLLRDLKKKEPEAVYIGVDVASGMLDLSEGLRVQADHSRMPFRRDSIDLVVSSSCYQWAEDLRLSFASAAAIIRPGGRFSAVFFGADTLRELFESLSAGSPALAERMGRMGRLPLVEDACAAISVAGFSSFDFAREFRREKFGSIKEILLWVRTTGGNGLGSGCFIGKEALNRAEEYYKRHFAGTVSFEVIWLEAGK